MNLTVSVALRYMTGCPECLPEVESTVAAALRDGQVTGVRLVAVPKCEHSGQKQKQRQLPGVAADAATPPTPPSLAPGASAPGSEPLLPGLEDVDFLPVSDVNGFDPDLVAGLR